MPRRLLLLAGLLAACWFGGAAAACAQDAARPFAPVTTPAAAASARGPQHTTVDPLAAAADGADGDDERQGSPAPRALTPPDPAEKKALEDRLAALEGAGLSEDDHRRALEFYQQALQSFDVAVQQIAQAAEFERQLSVLPTETEKYAGRLAKPLPPYEDVSGLPLAEVEQRAERVEASLAAYREDLATMIAEPKRRSQRMAELPKQIAETQQRLEAAAEQLAALGGEDAADQAAMARRAALAWCQTECKAILQALDREQQLYQQGSELITLRRDYFARYVPHKEKRLAQLREIINRLRAEEAQAQARLAAAAAEVERPAAIRDLATRNKQLADDRADVAARMTAVIGQLDAIRAELTSLTEQFSRAQQQARELSSLGGQLLRDQQAKLPNARALRRASALRESVRTDVLLHLYDLNDQRAELANLDELTEQIAARSGDVRAAVRAEIDQLLSSQRETLELLIADYEKYSRHLNELHSEEGKLIDLVDQYADFIAERVLWIRSCAPPTVTDGQHAARAVAWSLDPRNWRDVGQALLQACVRQPATLALFTIACAALVAVQRPARRSLRRGGDEAKKRGCTRLRPTIHAVGLTVLLALPWPALLAFVGLALDSLSESEFVRALGVATRFAAVCLLIVELSRHLCRQNGLADAHFDWPDKCLLQVRRKLRWLAVLGLPLTLWLVGLEAQSVEPYWSSSLGRALFIGVMLLLATVLHRLLLAAASPFRQLVLISDGGGWLAPLQIIWRPAVVVLPASLAVLAAVGYYYTAQQAALRILQTVGMLLAVLVLGGVTRRWLLVSRRRLAREQAKQRRAQLAAAADDDPGALTPADLVDENVDLAALSEQTQKLVRTFLALTMTVGLVLIWGEILPALKYPAKHLLPGAEVLTWGHLAMFLLVLGVTYISVRDVPALLELLILQHLPLDSGSRYAFTSMSRYVLAAIGLTAAFNSIGGEWAKIQWLVAAMSVGLGFGLQEIFANFVSGIILLFERPIRVGDVVTLGEKTGVVNRIRMRATTIVDWDRKEYVVPNKDLVTERLLNWTLSDTTNRVEAVVNVASGSDTELACALLLEAAREQPHVLHEPAPVALFDSFSDTGLKLVLRCFLPNLENRTSTIHALHTAIDRKLRAAGIETAYGDMRIRVARDAAHAPAPSRSVAFPAKNDRQGAA